MSLHLLSPHSSNICYSRYLLILQKTTAGHNTAVQDTPRCRTVCCRTIRCRTVHCRTVHCRTLCCRTLCCRTLCCRTLCCRTLCCRTICCRTICCRTSAAGHSAAGHSAAGHSAAGHSTAGHSAAGHSTAGHSTAGLHCRTLHCRTSSNSKAEGMWLSLILVGKILSFHLRFSPQSTAAVSINFQLITFPAVFSKFHSFLSQSSHTREIPSLTLLARSYNAGNSSNPRLRCPVSFCEVKRNSLPVVWKHLSI